MKELDDPKQYDWNKNPEAEAEYGGLKVQLSGLEMCPEESVGMKRLKELPEDIQRKAFDTYIVPRIEDAKKGDGNPHYIKHWKDMTFEKWVKEDGESFFDWDMPELMKDMPRAFGPFGMVAGWMSFRGKCIGYCELIPENLRDEAYTDMEPVQMQDYANKLDEYARKWEQDNSEIFSQLEKYKDNLTEWDKDNDWTVTLGMDDAKKNAHKTMMKKKYGDEFIGFQKCLCESNYYSYKNLVDAISWLRFWAEKGHGMWAWY